MKNKASTIEHLKDPEKWEFIWQNGGDIFSRIPNLEFSRISGRIKWVFFVLSETKLTHNTLYFGWSITSWKFGIGNSWNHMARRSENRGSFNQKRNRNRKLNFKTSDYLISIKGGQNTYYTPHCLTQENPMGTPLFFILICNPFLTSFTSLSRK